MGWIIYDPFGNFTASGSPPSGYGNVYGMAGMETDPALASGTTGMYHAMARYYHPGLQRFIAEDPKRGKANLFPYAGNNPVMNTDLSGMDCPAGDCAGGGEGQALVGAGSLLADLFQAIANFFEGLFSGGGPAPPPNFYGYQTSHQLGKTFKCSRAGAPS